MLRSRAEVRLALLFGSRARGTASPSSDLDLAVLAPGADLLEFAAALGHATGEVVDVISLADPGVPLLDERLRDGIPVYESRPGVYAQWRSHTSPISKSTARGTNAWGTPGSNESPTRASDAP